MSVFRLPLTLFMCFAINSVALASETKDDSDYVFELGVGIGHSSMPEYIGSEESKSYTVPFPYIYYRNKDLKIDRDSFTSMEFYNGRLRFGLDYGVNLPLDSEENDARRGMHDLDFVFMVGPKVELCLAIHCNKDYPLRAYASYLKPIITQSESWNDLDWVSRIGIKYDEKFIESEKYGTVYFTSSARVQYQGARYSGYYYGVTGEESLFDRPVYKSKSGFGGYQLSSGVRWRVGNWWIGAFAQYLNIGSAEVADSPLVTDPSNIRAGFAFAWIFKQ